MLRHPFKDFDPNFLQHLLPFFHICLVFLNILRTNESKYFTVDKPLTACSAILTVELFCELSDNNLL